jgi:membrane protein DedA with SNARE-associated domain
MNPQNIPHLLIEYRYWILVPLAVIEGPIVAFISGTLASLGYFNIYLLALFFFVRDMAMDAIYYYSGHFGARTSFIKKMLGKMNIKEDHLENIRLLWEKHPAKTMFVGKFSYGIAQAFIVVAGVVKMNIRKFFTYGALAAIAQYGMLLLLGYFFGNAFGGSITGIIENIQYVIAGAALLLSIYYLLRWYIGKKFPSGK